MSVMTDSIGSTMLVRIQPPAPAPPQECNLHLAFGEVEKRKRGQRLEEAGCMRQLAGRNQPLRRLVDQKYSRANSSSESLATRRLRSLIDSLRRFSSADPLSRASEMRRSIQRRAQPRGGTDARQRRRRAFPCRWFPRSGSPEPLLRIAQRSRQNSHLRQVELPPRGRGGKLLAQAMQMLTAGDVRT